MSRKNRITRAQTLKSTRKSRGRKTTRYATPQMQGAPAGVSQDLQQFTKFYPASSSSGIRMHTCAAISEIARETDASITGGLVQPGGVGASLQLNLTEPVRLGAAGGTAIDEYVSPVFDLIASAFTRFRVNRLMFHYEPQASATTTERLVFAFAPDPVHPLLWSNPSPGTAELLALADSVAFAPWRGWSMDVTSKLQNTLFYTFSDPTDSVSTFADRFSDFGVISVAGNTFGQDAAIKCGVLYMEIDVTLEEFCPIVSVSPASASLMVKRAGASVRKVAPSKPFRGKKEEPEEECCDLGKNAEKVVSTIPSQKELEEQISEAKRRLQAFKDSL